MNFLLDTNVVSEWVKPQPDARVVRWFGELDEDRAYLSVASLAEIRLGVERMAPGRRRERLRDWLEHDLPTRFEGRLLVIDAQVSQAWGELMARALAIGNPLSVMDGFFAATAHTHQLTLATRNTKDFAQAGVALFNPWVS
ncbi:MAG: type II toxin-antitoxin system VapC family toxin [Myxococcota bacterium]|nr:type II toxin-antitoxin system VapC family toxin [Myxococcota bacterium]